MKYIIEEELYFKIGSILQNYGDLLERLGEAFRSTNLDDDWRALDKIWDEYNSLPTYENKSTTGERREPAGERHEPAVGNRVRIIDSGECYTTYSDWVEKHVSEPSEKYLWDYGRSCDDGDTGKILFIAPHEYDTGQLAYVKMDNEKYGKCYLIGVRGLEKI